MSNHSFFSVTFSATDKSTSGQYEKKLTNPSPQKNTKKQKQNNNNNRDPPPKKTKTNKQTKKNIRKLLKMICNLQVGQNWWVFEGQPLTPTFSQSPHSSQTFKVTLLLGKIWAKQTCQGCNSFNPPHLYRSTCFQLYQMKTQSPPSCLSWVLLQNCSKVPTKASTKIWYVTVREKMKQCYTFFKI